MPLLRDRELRGRLDRLAPMLARGIRAPPRVAFGGEERTHLEDGGRSPAACRPGCDACLGAERLDGLAGCGHRPAEYPATRSNAADEPR